MHCFCPPGEKIIFLMMHNCSANWIILMMSQLNRIVWLVKIDVDRSSDFLTHVKYTHIVFSYNANFWLVYLLSDARFDWLLRNTVVQSMYWENIYQSCYKQTTLNSSVTLLERYAYNIQGTFSRVYTSSFKHSRPGNFLKVMQTLDCVSGSHNFLKFSQPPLVFRWECVNMEKRFSIA